MFGLYIYHILVLVIIMHNGDEPPKNDIKIYIKTAPTCFGAVTPPSGSLLIRAY